MKVKFKGSAYLPTYASIESVANGDEMPVICHGESDYWESQGYPLIGNVVVEITLHSKDKIVAAQIEVLHQQLQATRAENQQRENAILDKLSKLQALTFEPV